MPYKDPKLQQEANQRWHDAHVEEIRAYQREWKKKWRAAHPKENRAIQAKHAKKVGREVLNERHRKWRSRNLEKARAYSRKTAKRYNRELREETIAAYGNKCKCCGEIEKVFLSIDHIEGGGSAHRKLLGGASHCIYRWLKRNNFPQDDFRCLCMNCQIGYARNGICPHQLKKENKDD